MVQTRLICLISVICVVACAGFASGQQPDRPAIGTGDLSPAVEPVPGGIGPEPIDLPSLPGFNQPTDIDDLNIPDILQPNPSEPGSLPPGIGQSSQVPAQQAVDRSSGPQYQGNTDVRMALAPKMLGDFFGNTNTGLVVGEHFGVAVHQTIASGSSFANDNLSLTTVDTGSGNTVFVGGPAGLATASFFLPSIAPPLDHVVPGLTANGTDGSHHFSGVLTEATVDVFDNPADTSPSIPNAPVYNIFQISTLIVPAANPGDIVGRTRVQDNNSAMPQDRFYFDYNYFHNARFTGNGFGVNRFAPGFEKTFLDGLGSVEFRMPMAATLNSSSTVGTPFDTSNYEFGNLTISPKILLWASEEEAFAAGLGIALPTADDIEVSSASGQLLRINNESVHLIPYLAYLYTPRRTDYFVHAFLTLDVDTAGNDVDANVTGNGLEHVGVINDQTYLAFSTSLGKYIYRNNSRSSRIKALAWTSELHYTTSLNDADVVNAGAFQIGSPNADLSLLNGTVGGHVQLQNSTVTAGYTLPLTSNDRVFDGEFRLFINRPF